MAVKKNGMFEYNDAVNFEVSRSAYDNCLCSGCHNLGGVYQIKYPRTLYHDCMKLTTKYYTYWLCDDCTGKLVRAFNAARTEPPKEGDSE